jgi:hypothetical protein
MERAGTRRNKTQWSSNAICAGRKELIENSKSWISLRKTEETKTKKIVMNGRDSWRYEKHFHTISHKERHVQKDWVKQLLRPSFVYTLPSVKTVIHWICKDAFSTVRVIWHRMTGRLWMTYWKRSGSDRGLLYVTIQDFRVKWQKLLKTSLREADLCAEIRNRDFPSMKQRR